MIEALEGRTLCSGGELNRTLARAIAYAPTDSHLQWLVSRYYEYSGEVTEARERLKSAGDNFRVAAKEGAALLAADRLALRATKGDPVGLMAAKAKLENDGRQVRAELAEARVASSEARAAARRDQREATASLRSIWADIRFNVNRARGGGFAGSSR